MEKRIILTVSVLVFFFSCLPFVAFASGYIDVTVSQAKEMIAANPSIVILDVRTQSEYDSGHIRNAKLIPLGELEGRLDELNKADEILVYCMAGGRSRTACQILADNGFLHVYNLLGGITAWISESTPYASFTWIPSTPKVGELVTFNASSSDPRGGTITMYKWSFGDGGHGDGQTVTHAYSSLGSYIVTLNVTDSEGYWDVEEKQIQVIQPHGPEAEFNVTPETALTGEPIKFDASNSLPGWNGTHEMPISEYLWDFGDGEKTTTLTPIVYHTFSSSGIYHVTLTVYAPEAAPETDSTTHKVTVISIPVGGFTYSIERRETEKLSTLYLALVAILTVNFTIIKHKTSRRTKSVC